MLLQGPLVHPVRPKCQLQLSHSWDSTPHLKCPSFPNGHLANYPFLLDREMAPRSHKRKSERQEVWCLLRDLNYHCALQCVACYSSCDRNNRLEILSSLSPGVSSFLHLLGESFEFFPAIHERLDKKLKGKKKDQFYCFPALIYMAKTRKSNNFCLLVSPCITSWV